MARLSAALLLLMVPPACAWMPAGQSPEQVRQSPASARQQAGCGPASAHAKIRLSRPRSIVLDRGCNLFQRTRNAFRQESQCAKLFVIEKMWP